MFNNIFNEWASRSNNVQEDKDMSGMCCKDCGDEYRKPTKENKSCMYNAYNPNGKNWIEKVKEAMDAVDKGALKGKHKDRKDKDIDNDGDVDSSDKYLHKRRKAISKSIKKDKEGDIEMNPKLDKGSKENSVEQKESTIRQKLLAVLENKQTKGATKPETMDDKLKGKGAKDMVNQPKEVDDTEAKGHDDASKAGKVTKPAKPRNGGDQVRSGDQKMVNKVVDALKGMK